MVNIKHTHSNLSLESVFRDLSEMVLLSPKSTLKYKGRPVKSINLYDAVRIAGETYRRGCGMASRKKIPEESRNRIRELLFKARYVLDSRIENTMYLLIQSGEIALNRLLKRQVFGFCKKQGVSFRLSLSTCMPTRLCGGRCYAHDGRERVTSTILSGCYNTLLAKLFEEGNISENDILPHVKKAVSLAKFDAQFSQNEYEFKRRARIRLSHVGEIAAYPKFANWLGQSIKDLSDGEVDCVVYTRHPKINELDEKLLIINLTIDESDEKRRKWKKDGVRLVWSAWEGKLDSQADVNFLEHHDHGQHASAIGTGEVCPVTIAKTEQRFCDAFHCTKCFDNPATSISVLNSKQHFQVSGKLRTRHQGLIGEINTAQNKISEPSNE